MQVPVSGTRGLQQIQLVPPGQIQIQGGQAVQVQCQTQQIIIQQPQTAVIAGQTQTVWQEHRLFLWKVTPTQPAVGKGLSL